jgi:hypothetical protein
MHDASYYRAEAAHFRQVAERVHQPDVEIQLLNAARDFDEIAEDLERGLVEIRHRELLPQKKQKSPSSAANDS